jgi:hypothetical protein
MLGDFLLRIACNASRAPLPASSDQRAAVSTLRGGPSAHARRRGVEQGEGRRRVVGRE